MQLVELPVEQVMMRGGAFWIGALAVQLAASFVAARRTPDGLVGYAVTLSLGISYALTLLGGSIFASTTTSLALRTVSHELHAEVFAAICFVGGIVGLFASAFSASIVRYIGCRLAGVPVTLVLPRPRWDLVGSVSRRPAAASHAEADHQFGVINKIAWVVLVLVIGTCLWHDAPSWLLLFMASIIGVATIVASTIKPGLLSPSAMKADANAGLFTLTTFGPLGLALRAMYRFELVDWRLPLVIAVVVGLPATILQLRPMWNPSIGRVRTVLFALFLCYTGSGSLVWSALQFANDVGRPELVHLYPIRIAAKHAQRGKNDTMYWVNADDPPNSNGIKDLKVHQAMYDRLALGRKACIEVWRGKLLFRWYDVTDCGSREA